MALDFYRLGTDEYLYGIDHEQYDSLSEVFKTFEQWTGIEIDQYKNIQLTTENCGTPIYVITDFHASADKEL